MSTVYVSAEDISTVCSDSIAHMRIITTLLMLSDDIRPISHPYSLPSPSPPSPCLSSLPSSSSSPADRGATVTTTGRPCTECAATLSNLVIALVDRLLTSPRHLDHVNATVSDNSSQPTPTTGRSPQLWPADLLGNVRELDEQTERFAETCVNVAYSLAVVRPKCAPATPGVVDAYRVLRANADVALCADRLRQMDVARLAVPGAPLVRLCSSVGQSLGTLAEAAKSAAAWEDKRSATRQQLLRSIESFVASGRCFITSAKTLKRAPTESNRRRCSAFCDALLACTTAAVGYATERQFVGRPARLTSQAQDDMKGILGCGLTIASSCIRLLEVMRVLVYDQTNLKERQTLTLCRDSVVKATSQLAQLILTPQSIGRTIQMVRPKSLDIVRPIE